MVEVFRTNVTGNHEASELVELLLKHFPNGSVNFDLDDCDKILRVAHAKVCAQNVTRLLEQAGFVCELLAD